MQQPKLNENVKNLAILMFFQHVQVILTLQLAIPIVCSLQFGIIVISSYSHLKKEEKKTFIC